MTSTLLQAVVLNAGLAALLAVLAACLAWLFRGRPALVHGLWLLVLLKLVTPPIFALPLSWPMTRQSPVTSEVAPVAEEGLSGGECPRTALLPEVVPPSDESPNKNVHEEAPEAAVRDEAASPWWPGLVLAVWWTGALTCWVVAGVRLLRLCRILRAVPRAPREVQQRIDHLAARLGLRCSPQAFVAPVVIPPMLLAFSGPSRLLVPEELWWRLDATQRDTLLLHELAHLRRGDHWLRWVELMVLGLYWWYPLAWWVSRQLRDAEEQCCDAWVVWAAPHAAGAYATTLVETIAYLSQTSAALPAGASGAGPVRLIKRRLTMILRGTTPRGLSRPALVVMGLLAVGLLPLAPTMVRSGPPAERRSVVAQTDPTSQLIATQRSCRNCHAAPHSSAQPTPPIRKTTEDLHAEVLRLIREVTERRAQLTKSETALKDVLKRFEAQQIRKVNVRSLPPPRKTTDPRLESLEKKLERLLKEVEDLRKELHPNQRQSSAPAGQSNDPNTRTIRLPVRRADEDVKERRPSTSAR